MNESRAANAYRMALSYLDSIETELNAAHEALPIARRHLARVRAIFEARLLFVTRGRPMGQEQDSDGS